MIATDRPRLHLCARCVGARGLERGEAYQRIAADTMITGVCEDCHAEGVELEAWRSLEAPPPSVTLPVLPPDGEP